MVTQVPLFSEPLPDPLSQTSEEFESSSSKYVAEQNPRIRAANAQALEVNEASLNALTAVEGLANAVWVSGTTYTAGQVRWSPADSYSYRRRTNGAGTTDPSLDPTNWALLTKTSNGGSDTTSSAVDIALTSTSGRLQIIAMTAAGKKVTLPSATGLSKGVPIFVIKNTGAYRFAVRRNGGLFLCWINPGQVVSFGCSDISTSAGIWTISGDAVGIIYDGNTPEVLNAVDSRFIAVAMLTATKAICAFKNNSTGFLEAVILNYGSASGTPAAINAEAVRNISIAAQTSTQATVIYQLNAASTIKGYVLDVSGNTITPGTAATILTNATNTASQQGTSLTVLSATKLLCAYIAAGAATIKEKVLDIAGSVITASSEVTADNTGVLANFIYARGISSAKAITCGASSTQIFLRLQSITSSTPAPTGSLLTLVHDAATLTSYGVCILSSVCAVVVKSVNRGIAIFAIDITGTTPVLFARKMIPINTIDNMHLSVARINSNQFYVSWPGNYSLGVDGMLFRITGDNLIAQYGEIEENMELGVANSNGYLDCVALDSLHIMQVCRDASTFLSAKTIEIS